MVRCVALIAALMLCGCDERAPGSDGGPGADAATEDAGQPDDGGPGLLFEVQLDGSAGAELEPAVPRLIIGGETFTCAYLAGEEPPIAKAFRMHYRTGDGPEVYPGSESWMPPEMLCDSHANPWPTMGTRHVLEGAELEELCSSGEPLTVTQDLIERASSELLGRVEVSHSTEFVADYCSQLGF